MNWSFGPTSDEEFALWDLVYTAGEYQEDGRCRFLILAFIKGINDDESQNTGGFERTDNKLLHLRAEGLPSDNGMCLQDLEQLLSEKWILISELENKCREDHLEIAAVLKVLQAEEAGPKFSVCKAHLGECLCDG